MALFHFTLEALQHLQGPFAHDERADAGVEHVLPHRCRCIIALERCHDLILPHVVEIVRDLTCTRI